MKDLIKKKLLFRSAIFISLLSWVITCYGQEIKIGILAPYGNAKAISIWQPTVDYLQKQIPQYSFKLMTGNRAQLSQWISQKQVHFFLTNTGHYVELEEKYAATRILTLKRKWRGQTYYNTPQNLDH